jgi:hypothetical protein
MRLVQEQVGFFSARWMPSIGMAGFRSARWAREHPLLL